MQRRNFSHQSNSNSVHDTMASFLSNSYNLKNPESFSYKLAPKVRFRYFALATVSLPLGGLIFGVLWAMYMDYEAATNTHCGDRAVNYLPSLSAAIGFSRVNDVVWKMCIGLHAIPRFIVTGMYVRYFCSVIHHEYVIWGLVACIFNAVENIGLIGLTFMTSKLHYEMHKLSFVLFLMSFEIYILIMVILLTNCRYTRPNKVEQRSLTYKRRFMILNFICLFMICFTFHRHNTHCEHFVYTIFALFEYILVLANIGFHMTAYWDFYDRVVTLVPTKSLNLPHYAHSNYQ